ncbi:MAG: sigma factor [Nitrososphaerota archaeon]
MIRKIKGIPPLSEEEERECLKRYKETGDKEALDKLVLSNQGFVFNVAMSAYKKMHKNIGGENCIIEFEDLLSTGNLGLLRAIQTFDLSLNTRLLTYAGHWISAFIDLYIKKETNRSSSNVCLEDTKDVSDNTWDEYDSSSLEHNINKSTLMNDLLKEGLTNEELLYVYSATNSLPIDLTKEELANIMLKPSVRSIDCRKTIRKKISKKKLKKKWQT